VSKNIWILNHYAVSPDMAGGTRHYDLGRELVRKGHKVIIFASGFDHITKKYIKSKPKEKYRVEDFNGLNFVWLNTLPYSGNNWRRILNMISYGIRILRVAKKFDKPDVIVGSSMHPFAVMAAWWLAKRYKAKFIFEVRDLWPQSAIDMNVIQAKGIPAKMLYIWEKFMYKRAKEIIVLMPNAKNYLKKLGIDSQKIVWIPNSVDLERFDNPGPLDPFSDVAKTFGKYKDKFNVVYAGAHGIPNEIDTIVNAAALIEKITPDIHFIFIGEGTEKEKLKLKTKKLKLNNITFVDPVSKNSLSNILSFADCLVISMLNINIYRYGVSLNKSFDYLASAKPIIMAGNPKNNIIEDAKAGITVEPEKPETLVEGIIKIQKMSPEERKRLGINGRTYVEKYYSSRVIGDKLEEIL